VTHSKNIASSLNLKFATNKRKTRPSYPLKIITNVKDVEWSLTNSESNRRTGYAQIAT
jgi:hypothetical protein